MPKHVNPGDFIPSFQTYLAWEFTHLEPGTFKRNKADFAHHDYPILAPQPSQGRHTDPLEISESGGPFIYFVHDGTDRLCYVGKCDEASVVHRWVRPATNGNEYWTHSTKSGGNVFNIAEGLQRGEGPYRLSYAPMSNLLSRVGSHFGIGPEADPKVALKVLEAKLLTALRPAWNKQGLSATPRRRRAAASP